MRFENQVAVVTGGAGGVGQTLVRLLAREGEKLTHKIRRPVGILLDLHGIGEGLVTGLMTLQQQIAKPDDRRQHIVEIMGNSTCHIPK